MELKPERTMTMTTNSNTCKCSKPSCDIWSPYYDGTCRYCGKLVDLSGGDQ